MEKAQEAVDAAKDAASAAEQGNPSDEASLEKAKESAQEAISKAEGINQNEQQNASSSEEVAQTEANQQQLEQMRDDVDGLDSSQTPLDRQRGEVRDLADKAEAAAEAIPEALTQEEVTEKRKEAVQAAIDAYEKADMDDPTQAADVDRAKRAAQEAVNNDPNITQEELEEITEQLDAIPSEEDELRKAFDESGLPEDLFDEFKAGWDEFMEGLRQEQAKNNLKMRPPSKGSKTDVNRWLKRPESGSSYYVNVSDGNVELLKKAPPYGSDLVMVAPYNTGELDRQGQPLIVPTVLQGVEEWWYQTGNRREDLIYEDSTTLRIQNAAGWADKPDSMRFFDVDTDGDDLLVRY
jgi:hypothetical protein